MAIAPTPTGDGYLLVSAAGEVAAFGDATHHGDTAGMTLARPVVGLGSTATGRGYWMLTDDGGISAFGDAAFLGSAGNDATRPLVAMEVTPSGRGYWLVEDGGRIWAFGDATQHGHTGDIKLNTRIVDLSATPSGNGYWMVAENGGIFAFGGARFSGSVGGLRLNGPITEVVGNPAQEGYWLVGRDGSVFAFGQAARFPGAYGVATRDGEAKLAFTSAVSGPSTITAAGSTATLSLDWTAGMPTGLTLTGPTGPTPTNRPALFLARATDSTGAGMDGVSVRFDASGTGTEGPTSGLAHTSGGEAQFFLGAYGEGRSTVTATVPGLDPVTAAVDWVFPTPDLWAAFSPVEGPLMAGDTVPVAASVWDRGNVGVVGARVRFDLSGAGASVADPGACAPVSPTRLECTVDVSGHSATTARIMVRTGARGTLRVTATVDDPSGREPIAARGDNTASTTYVVKDAAATVMLTQGQPRATSGTVQDAVARVEDAGGQPVADGALVTFRLDSARAPDGPLAGIAGTPSGLGYWIASAAGTVQAHGDAPRLPRRSPRPWWTSTPRRQGRATGSPPRPEPWWPGATRLTSATGPPPGSRPPSCPCSPPRAAPGTGWSTAGARSTPSGTPPSSATRTTSTSTGRSSPWPAPAPGRATGSSPPTAASSPSATPPSRARPARRPWTDRSWTSSPCPAGGATATSPPPASCTPSAPASRPRRGQPHRRPCDARRWWPPPGSPGRGTGGSP